jgi:hypothetical protein
MEARTVCDEMHCSACMGLTLTAYASQPGSLRFINSSSARWPVGGSSTISHVVGRFEMISSIISRWIWMGALLLRRRQRRRTHLVDPNNNGYVSNILAAGRPPESLRVRMPSDGRRRPSMQQREGSGKQAHVPPRALLSFGHDGIGRRRDLDPRALRAHDAAAAA